MADIVRPGEPAGGPLNAGMRPENVDLYLYKGDYVELLLTIRDSEGNPINLTGYTPSASIRSSHSSETAYPFTATITNASGGQVRLLLPTSVSTTIPPGSHVWDFQLTNASGNARTYFTGDVTVEGEVTR